MNCPLCGKEMSSARKNDIYCQTFVDIPGDRRIHYRHEPYVVAHLMDYAVVQVGQKYYIYVRGATDWAVECPEFPIVSEKALLNRIKTLLTFS